MAREPAEVGANRGQAAVLGHEGDGTAVGFAVVEEPALVALQDRARHLPRPLDTAFREPLDQALQVELASSWSGCARATTTDTAIRFQSRRFSHPPAYHRPAPLRPAGCDYG